jgi:hypothetical protein
MKESKEAIRLTVKAKGKGNISIPANVGDEKAKATNIDNKRPFANLLAGALKYLRFRARANKPIRAGTMAP